MNELVINEQNIQSKIFTIRDKQVMIDRNLRSQIVTGSKQGNKYDFKK